MSDNKRFECIKGSRIIIDNETKLHYIMTLDWECSLVTKLLNRFVDENEQLKSANMEYEDALGRLEEQLKQNNQTIDLLFKQIGAFRDDCVVYMDFSGVATLDRLIEILEDSMGIMNGDDND